MKKTKTKKTQRFGKPKDDGTMAWFDAEHPKAKANAEDPTIPPLSEAVVRALDEADEQAWHKGGVLLEEIRDGFEELKAEDVPPFLRAALDPKHEEVALAAFTLGALMGVKIRRRLGSRMSAATRTSKKTERERAFADWLDGRDANKPNARAFLAEWDEEWLDRPDSDRDAKIATLVRAFPKK